MPVIGFDSIVATDQGIGPSDDEAAIPAAAPERDNAWDETGDINNTVSFPTPSAPSRFVDKDQDEHGDTDNTVSFPTPSSSSRQLHIRPGHAADCTSPAKASAMVAASAADEPLAKPSRRLSVSIQTGVNWLQRVGSKRESTEAGAAPALTNSPGGSSRRFSMNFGSPILQSSRTVNIPSADTDASTAEGSATGVLSPGSSHRRFSMFPSQAVSDPGGSQANPGRRFSMLSPVANLFSASPVAPANGDSNVPVVPGSSMIGGAGAGFRLPRRKSDRQNQTSSANKEGKSVAELSDQSDCTPESEERHPAVSAGPPVAREPDSPSSPTSPTSPFSRRPSAKERRGSSLLLLRRDSGSAPRRLSLRRRSSSSKADGLSRPESSIVHKRWRRAVIFAAISVRWRQLYHDHMESESSPKHDVMVVPISAKKPCDDDEEQKSALDDNGPALGTTAAPSRSPRDETEPFEDGAAALMPSAVFHVNLAALKVGNEEDVEHDYEDGCEIVHAGKNVGRIVKRLGQGRFGPVYELKLPDGSLCGLKTISETGMDSARRRRLRQQLTTDASTCFACGRSESLASVQKMIVPLAKVPTNAQGLLILCDLAESDLHATMHSGNVTNGELDLDYAGKLYTSLASMWSIESIVLQVYTAFEYLHGRGIMHLDFCPEKVLLTSGGLVKLTDYGE